MADLNFIKTLEELNKLKTLNTDKTNEIILKYFPNKDFLEADEQDVYVLFTKLIPYKMNNLKVHNLPKILKLINKVFPKLYKSNTLDNYFSKFVRNPISKRFGVDSKEHMLSKKLARLPYEEKGQLLKDAKDKVFKKNSNRTEFATEKVFQIIKDNIDSQDPMRKAIALLVASGSRPIELFEKANYTAEDDIFIKQDYLAKKKGVITHVIKPIIYLSPHKFITELEVVRKELHKKYTNFLEKNGQLKSSLNAASNKAAKEIFENQEGFTTYTARKLYGKLSYDLYHLKTDRFGVNPKFENWLSAVLGHKEGSTTAAANYSNFDLTNERSKDTNDEILALQAVIVTKLDDLEESFNVNDVPKINKDIDQTKVFKNNVMNADFKTLQTYVDAQPKRPSQTTLENKYNGVISRNTVRLFYKKLKLGEI